MDDSLYVVWIIFVPFALLFLIGAALIILKSQRDVIIDYPMAFLLIGRFVFCGCVVIILCVVDFGDMDWTESLCFLYYWTYATTSLFDSFTICVTLCAMLILVSYRRSTIKHARSLILFTIGVLLLISIATVGAVFIYKEEIHPYPFAVESNSCTFVPKQLHAQHLSLGMMFSIIIWVFFGMIMYGSLLTLTNLIYVKYRKLQNKMDVYSCAGKQNGVSNSDGVVTTEDTDKSSAPRDINPCMSSDEMFLLLDRRLVLGVATVLSLVFNSIPLCVLIIYSLVSDDDYMHGEAIVLGGSLMYALLLPTLVCSISQRYWHTVNKYRIKLGHRMVDPPKKPPENGVVNKALNLTEESPVDDIQIGKVTVIPPAEHHNVDQSEDEYSDDNLSDSTWDEQMSSYRASPNPSMMVQMEDETSPESQEPTENDDVIESHVIIIERTTSVMQENDDIVSRTSSFRLQEDSGTTIIRNRLGYVNTRSMGQSDTEYENCDSEGSIRDQQYNDSDIDIGMSSDSGDLNEAVEDEIGDQAANQSTLQVPGTEHVATIRTNRSPKLNRHVLYVNEMAREAYEARNDKTNPVQRSKSAVDRGVADGRDSSEYYIEDSEKSTFMDDLNSQRAFMDKPGLSAVPKNKSEQRTEGKPKVSLWKTKVMPLVLRSRQERDSAVAKAWQNVMTTQKILDYLKAKDDDESVVDDEEAWATPAIYDNPDALDSQNTNHTENETVIAL